MLFLSLWVLEPCGPQHGESALQRSMCHCRSGHQFRLGPVRPTPRRCSLCTPQRAVPDAFHRPVSGLFGDSPSHHEGSPTARAGLLFPVLGAPGPTVAYAKTKNKTVSTFHTSTRCPFFST